MNPGERPIDAAERKSIGRAARRSDRDADRIRQAGMAGRARVRHRIMLAPRTLTRAAATIEQRLVTLFLD
ncbi:MAG TPA: hypothetical protein VKT77_09540 [Chthonomonadaceae bacterium]|nr:hypothetical protein [Chthonomonadaceae bacterium]